MVSENEIRDYYNQRHCSLGKNAWRPYQAYPIFLHYLNVKPGRKLLDVGCGTGYLLKAADERGLETYGVDVSDEGVKVAQKISPNSKIIVGKGEDLKFADNYFDYVTCLGALEHFLDMEKGVKEIVRVGKNNALFCIVVPNVNFLYWTIRGSKGTEQQDLNENLLSLKQWKNILSEAGLEVLRIHQDRGPMQKVTISSFANPLKAMKKLAHKTAFFCLPLGLTYQFVFVLRKR